MTCLLDEPRRACLRLANLLRSVALRVLKQIARLVSRRVHYLGTLALGFLAVALDLGLAVLQVALALRHLLLGPGQLVRRGLLSIAFERVGELGGGADQVQGVHANGVTGRLDVAGPTGGLDHAELRLELGGVAAESVESGPPPIRVGPPA